MADQRIIYTEEMVGASHPTKDDTLNRHALIEHDNDGTHKVVNTGYVTVASHATTSAIWAAAGNTINFTGTETITDFPAATKAGSIRTLICAGACIFTHAGNITVQGGATYTASANDEVQVTAITTSTFKIMIKKQAGAAIPGANTDITSMTGLDDDGIPLAKVANAASDGANSDITSLTGLTSAGALPSLTPVTDSAANFAANFTGANLYGGTFICNVTGTCQLPLMVAGMNFTVITLGAIEVIVDTNAADGYLMDGTTNAEGKNLTNLSTAGDIAVFQYYTADDWLITTNGWTPEV